ncbi:MAG: helix-turn-helix transcriptional regulator [Bacteroidales bacterium]|nr:helix-turn-helix transcriptional regulator [Bacteroidales bacterium]
MGHKYKANDSLAELISNDFKLLQVLSRFGIALGFGDKLVEQVCKENNVDTETFVAVCNFISQGIKPSFDEFTSLNAGSLLTYLRNSHNFFLDFMLPSIRREFVDSVDCSTRNEIGFLILKFFDDYVAEIAKHQTYESDHLFTYVEGLLQGKRKADTSLANFENDRIHTDHDKLIAQKMSDLKNIIIRYCPNSAHKEQLNDALLHLFEFETDLSSHTQLEDTIFIPVVSLLESQVDINEETDDTLTESTLEKDTLSEREKDIIVGVVKGQTNKEIADHLCISIHTVLTHRRNIARKLGIHSPAGLVIYAIVNGIISIEDIKDLSYT